MAEPVSLSITQAPNKTDVVNEHRKRYITRRERLDMTKTQTKSAFYGLNELRYCGEYSTHMYGWYLTFWAYNTKIPLFSSLAESSNRVDIDPHTWESGKDFWRNIFYLILGWLGV